MKAISKNWEAFSYLGVKTVEGTIDGTSFPWGLNAGSEESRLCPGGQVNGNSGIMSEIRLISADEGTLPLRSRL